MPSRRDLRKSGIELLVIDILLFISVLVDPLIWAKHILPPVVFTNIQKFESVMLVTTPSKLLTLFAPPGQLGPPKQTAFTSVLNNKKLDRPNTIKLFKTFVAIIVKRSL